MTPKEFLLGKDGAKSVAFSDLLKVTGRDELRIFGDDKGAISGTMATNIETSTHEGKPCLFVTISTGFHKRKSFRSLCQVSGFVDIDLYTLEERRIITSKSFKGPGNDVPEEEEESGFSSSSSSSRSRRKRSNHPSPEKDLRDFQNCRSLILADDVNCGGKIIIPLMTCLKSLYFKGFLF